MCRRDYHIHILKGKQHGKIDIILGIHLGAIPENGTIDMILGIITAHYLFFAMLFMQPWGEAWILIHSAVVITLFYGKGSRRF